ncbi:MULTISPECIES: LysM peptidoglycan-binding domain-containing M23 family metallopeptidase [Paenibacillus]|uniref:LysM peptidoglycan-binding domain-containing M23 family metallopeptidase n=1 Tax=Paenibacillus TaxID=44249 RepID=UPI0022B8EF95|nr:M23 family metallopeptidase [Paenibacillus caseinilyticus]MCZ8521423.1 M23 family metallopeptidase [Paenibacillus caseinilyticus]
MNRRGYAGRGPRVLLQWAAALTVIVTVVISGRWFVTAGTSPAYDVFLDGEWVGAVSHPEVVRQWRDERYAELGEASSSQPLHSNLEGLSFVPKQTLLPTRDTGLRTAEESRVLAALGHKLQIDKYAVEIRVDGRTVGVVSDMETAFSILEKVKAPYLMEAETGTGVPATALAAGFQEAVELMELPVVRMTSSADGSSSPEEADAVYARLVQGEEQPFLYNVKQGDCLSLIAVRHAVSVEEIRRLNPQLRGDRIRTGDELALSRPRPLLTVRVEAVRTRRIPLASGVRYVDDMEMKKGQVRVASQGQQGITLVTYRTVTLNGTEAEVQPLGEAVLSVPVPSIVLRGTKAPADRGTGRFALPVLQPKVTSGFGRRWGRAHNGTDLVSERRDILASDAGRITFAGWKSGYGRTIVIDHGNGYETLYGHLSRIGVKEGEAVEKGEKIGVMGSSGNSTGVHLHFEMIKDGRQLNPLRYITVPAAA